MLLLFRLLSHVQLRVLHAVGAALGWLVFLASPTYRRRFALQARQAGYTFAQVRPAVAHIGRMVGELPRLWLGPPVAAEFANPDCLDRAYEAGRGVLLLTPHLGCFEVTAQAIARRHMQAHGPLTVLFRPARKPWLAPLIAASRQRPGLEPAPTTLAGVRQMIKALRQGHAVGLLPDQVPPEGMGAWAPFFGRPAYTMTLAARLAQQTGCEVRLLWGERLPAGRGFRVHCRELDAPLEGTLEQAVARMNQGMERLIRECPEQYLWSYARYKPPRQPAGGGQ
jgi:KDO2-lipid IV(A) lauroyltransferase